MRSLSRVPFFNTGARFSLFFMALMVFVIIIVLSVFIGFQKSVHDTLENSGDHLRVLHQENRPFKSYKRILKYVKKNNQLQTLVRHSFANISLNVLFDNHYNQFEGKGLRGIPLVPLKKGKDKKNDIEESFAYFPRIVHYNKRYLERFKGGNYVLIGREMARYYGLNLGDRISILFPKGGFLSKNIAIQEQSFRIAGFYRTGFYEFDLNLIFMSLQTAQRILQIPNRASELVVQLNSLDDLDEAYQLLADSLPRPNYEYTIHTIREARGNFLAALQLEKTLMLIILSLLIIAGVAGIWVTVRLLIRSKLRSIGMLRAMGMSTKSLFIIFSAHSMCIGFLATIIGGSLGIYVANRMETLIGLVEDLINNVCPSVMGECAKIYLIPPNVYYFDHLPVQADLGIIFGITISTLILSGLAGYLPAREAVRLEPIQSIRNE